MALFYHPGRRKRREIMKDLAVGAVFGLDAHARQRVLPYHSRLALEALIEVSWAFGSDANRERCDIAVMKTLNKSRNTARDAISGLERSGLVEFVNNKSGSCVKIPVTTQKAFKMLEDFDHMINVVTHVEDKLLDQDITKELKALRDAGVYLASTDCELDAAMKKSITEALPKKKTRKMNTITNLDEQKGKNAMSSSKALLLSFGLLLLSVIAPSNSAAADRAGTVGLGTELASMSNMVSSADRAGTVGL